MRIAITGGSGFVGSHLARQLTAEGVEVVSIARGVREAAVGSRLSVVRNVSPGRGPDNRQPTTANSVHAAIDDAGALARAFAGCDAVAHLAGINRELGEQTYERVHTNGTRAVLEAARRAGVRKIVFLSFLRARPDCGSAYHESKWQSEELVRASGLDYTIVKAGMTYGRGDHMLDHLSHALHTFPIFLTVGFREQSVRPLAIDDLVAVLRASLVDGRLSRQTVAVTGAEEMTLSDAVRRVAAVIDAKPLMLPAPVRLHAMLAHVWEWTMKVPLAAIAQVRILSETCVEPAPFADPLPADLTPRLRFTDEQIRAGLPKPGRFTTRDLRCARV